MERSIKHGASSPKLGDDAARRYRTWVPDAESWLVIETLRGWTAKDSERFWRNVDKSGGPNACWVWTGSTNSSGYGHFLLKRKHWGSHRLVLSLRTGFRPKELFCCHKCDNPPCCNPAHLFWGTSAENNTDSRQKGRAWTSTPEQIKRAHEVLVKRYEDGILPASARFTEAEVLDMRTRWANGETQDSIAKSYKAGPSTVGKIVRRTSYRTIG